MEPEAEPGSAAGGVGVAGSNPKCGSFSGTGLLQQWDATLNGGLGGRQCFLDRVDPLERLAPLRRRSPASAAGRGQSLLRVRTIRLSPGAVLNSSGRSAGLSDGTARVVSVPPGSL